MKGSLPEENYKFEFHFVNLLKFNFYNLLEHLVCILQSSYYVVMCVVVDVDAYKNVECRWNGNVYEMWNCRVNLKISFYVS